MARLGTIVVDVGDGKQKVGLDKLMPIGQDLSSEFAEQPSLYAWVAVMAARGEAVWLDSKRELERVYADMDKDVRRDYETSGEKITEPRVKAEIKRRKGYVESQLEELDCREQHLTLQAVVKALDMRAQMLISLGAHLRAEAQQTGMTISGLKDTLRVEKANTEKERLSAQQVLKDAETKDVNGTEDEDGVPF